MALCAAGVAHRTALEWLSDSPPEMYQSACLALAARLKEAELACAAGLFANIHRAAQDPRYWTAAAWTLERKHGYIVQQQGMGGPTTVVNIGRVIITQAGPGVAVQALDGGESDVIDVIASEVQANAPLHDGCKS